MKYFNEKEKIWSAKPAIPVFNSNISVGQAILWTLEQSPNKIGQVSDDGGAITRLTNGEIRLKTIRAVQNLLKLEFAQGDVFGFVARNSQHLAQIVFAGLILGCPVNPLHESFDRKEMTYLFGITRPKVVFCDVDKVDVVKDSLKEIGIDVPIFTFGGMANSTRPVEDLFVDSGTEEEFVAPLIKDVANHMAFIVYSSGTTGTSKGACLSHSAVLLQGSQYPALSDHDTILCRSSLYWISEPITLIAGSIKGVTRLITTDPLTPNRLIHLVESHRVTIVHIGTAFVHELLKYGSIESADLSSVTHLFFGGIRNNADLTEKMNRYLPNGRAYEAYGSTELCLFVTNSYPESRNQSTGKILNGFQVKVVDDDGNKCGIGQDGEIYVKFPHMFLGYYKQPEATARVFVDEGWFRTGDVGHLDEDGFLFFKERKSEYNDYCGYRISPTEIEDVLLSHPIIRAACVVGVSDPIVGEWLVALVIKHPEMDVAAEELENLVAENVTDYKRLRGGVFFVKSLPATPSGKLVRWKAREMAKTFRRNISII